MQRNLTAIVRKLKRAQDRRAAGRHRRAVAGQPRLRPATSTPSSATSRAPRACRSIPTCSPASQGVERPEPARRHPPQPARREDHRRPPGARRGRALQGAAMIRLFAAIEVPPRHRRGPGPPPAGHPRRALAHAEQMHITLRFFGEIPETHGRRPGRRAARRRGDRRSTCRSKASARSARATSSARVWAGVSDEPAAAPARRPLRGRRPPRRAEAGGAARSSRTSPWPTCKRADRGPRRRLDPGPQPAEVPALPRRLVRPLLQLDLAAAAPATSWSANTRCSASRAGASAPRRARRRRRGGGGLGDPGDHVRAAAARPAIRARCGAARRRPARPCR